MSTLRRLTQGIGVLLLAAVGTLLVLEATEAVSGEWRQTVANGFENVATPTWPLWLSAVVGAAGAIAGVIMFAAQFAPAKRGFRTMHQVHSDGDGETRLRGRAAIAAVRHELSKIDGVVEVVPTVRKKRMYVELLVDDRANVAEVEETGRSLLGHEFWINLGLADFAVDLMVTHHPKPPRVR